MRTAQMEMVSVEQRVPENHTYFMVEAMYKREQVQKYESEALLERSFEGSLTSFLAAFLRDRKLTSDEADELRRMIEEASK